MGYLRNHQAAVSLALCLSAGFLPGASTSYISPRETRVTQQPPPTTAAPTVAKAAESFTAVSDCHLHGTSAFCLYGSTELQVVVPSTATSDIPATYTECHSHGDQSYCVGPDGSDVEVLGLTAEGSAEDSHGSSEQPNSSEQSSSPEPSSSSGSGGQNCHFHAGVEHCVGAEGESESSETKCSRQDRDYNIPLRIGLLFVILVTSFIGVAGPIFLKPVLPGKYQVVFVILKQFGTGVIIATAFVHLFTHATLMFTNECLGELGYEATTAAIVMAGLFLAFIVEYASHRLAHKLWSRSQCNDEVVGVVVLEAGIVFHSLLIGVTLVVASDSFFITLFVVILFHQMFEGIALGTRIASVGYYAGGGADHGSHASSDDSKGPSSEEPITAAHRGGSKSLSTLKKLLMAAVFAVITPVGMAIGIGVLQRFNGNDPSTLIALGTLDALSAGILVWVGLIEMWAGDWMFGGELANAGAAVTTCAGVGLVAGMALMSLLGKWA
ncbi:Zip-domain-containing protein [Xylariaceae sp. FL0662B]|nr:Zip-domain-containing protein [Xylariaceae sp. FL0662B]